LNEAAPLALITIPGTIRHCEIKISQTPIEGSMLRKQLLQATSSAPMRTSDAIDVAAVATVLVTSEDPGHPIDHAFDDSRGPGGSRWIAGEPGEQTVILAFDNPQAIHRVALEVEEPEVARTQELQLAVSTDGGRSYRELLRQEYNFSPPGTMFEWEDWVVNSDAVTHLRLVIRPDKGGQALPGHDHVAEPAVNRLDMPPGKP
jgi:hypothetical protein